MRLMSDGFVPDAKWSRQDCRVGARELLGVQFWMNNLVRDNVNWELIQEVRGWLHFDRERSALFRRARACIPPSQQVRASLPRRCLVKRRRFPRLRARL